MRKTLILLVVLCFALTACNPYTSKSGNPPTAPSETSFDFSKYLPFTPRLPTYTDGYRLAYSYIVRNLDPQHGDVIQYWADYGNPRGTCIQVEEATPQVFRLLGIHPPLSTAVTLTKNNVEYIVWSQGNAATQTELKRVAESIRQPAQIPPDEINASEEGESSWHLVDGFHVVRPGSLDLPSRSKLTSESAANDIEGTQKTESYSMVYNTVEIDEVKHYGNWSGPTNNGFDGAAEMINGVEVTFERPAMAGRHDIDAAAFTNPHTGVEFIMFNKGLTNSEFNRLLSAVVKASLSSQQ